MRSRMKKGWLALGMGAVAALIVVVALAVSIGAGPSEPAPGPEEYHIYDGREGIQVEAEVINASRAVTIMEDPVYNGPVAMIVFGMSPTSRYTEIYDRNGYAVSKLTTTTTIESNERTSFTVVDAGGNVLAEGGGYVTGDPLTLRDPAHPLYSYKLGAAITPYWLALLQQS